MNNFQGQTLAQIVTQHHEAATVFEKYGLDFCCKGKRTLEVACADKQVAIDHVINHLNSVLEKPSQKDFDKLSVCELADHIVNVHHAYVRYNMPQILSFLERVASKHGGRHPEMVQVLETFSNLCIAMEEHMLKEERILFPRLAELERVDHVSQIEFIEAPISVLEEDHDEAGELMEKIRQLTNNYQPPADACTTYRLSFSALQGFETDLHQHVHLENNILFPKAMALVNKLQNAFNA